MACCLNLTFVSIVSGAGEMQIFPVGTFNGANFYEFEIDGRIYFIYWISGGVGVGQWLMSVTLGGLSPLDWATKLVSESECPPFGVPSDGTWDAVNPINFTDLGLLECSFENCQEDRTKEEFKSIKLPSDFVEDDRGIKGCCCKFLVLADPSSDTWKNDKTSAWIKTSDPSDTYDFKLYKDGALTTYNPTETQFPQDTLAYYTTVNWIDVLNSDGVGCYELVIEYSISGITGSLSWGEYDLQAYSIQNAINTARVRAVFNGIQEIQGINFTGSDVESSFRFYGYIGNRQPNTETDNIIYNNREMKRVMRENLNTYEIITDPSDDCIIRPLVDLYLLSENQLFISDYNATNPSYRYQDIPVIVSESPSLEYFDQSRKVRLICVVSDKFKNKRTYY
tara:strand:+ start:3131 stop:4312 length:1182 start_codon:yes stop_codon:yes gene_type:complete